MEIIAAEGPMVVRRAFRRYAQALGMGEAEGELKSILNSILFRARTSRTLLLVDELGRPGQINSVVRVPSAPACRPRTIGPRGLDEIPPSEIVAACRTIRVDPASFAAGELGIIEGVLAVLGHPLAGSTDPGR
jgi:hypothetical protein